MPRPSNSARMRWAVLGTGAVAHAFAESLVSLDDTLVTAVTSRRFENAQRFATAFRSATARADPADAVTADDVDAVYIATPPSTHRDLALLAIGAGKPVLVEKPFADSASAAREIAAAARTRQVFCMEAVWTRFLPLMTEVKRRCTNGALGELVGLDAEFCQSDEVDAAAPAFSPEAFGGALAHKGVYALNLARWLLGSIDTVDAALHIGPTGVDDHVGAVLNHHDGAITTIRTSTRTSGTNSITVYGTAGRLDISGPIYRPVAARMVAVHPRLAQSLPTGARRLARSPRVMRLFDRLPAARMLVTRSRGERIFLPPQGIGYHYQAAEVATAVTRGWTESPTMSLDESLDVATIVETIKEQSSA